MGFHVNLKHFNIPHISYIIAMLILTLGEMLILPAVPAAAQLALKEREGAYQGVIGGATSGGRMVGPLLGGMMYDYGGSSSVWTLAIAFMGASLVMFFIYGKAVQRFHLLRQTEKTATT